MITSVLFSTKRIIMWHVFVRNNYYNYKRAMCEVQKGLAQIPPLEE